MASKIHVVPAKRMLGYVEKWGKENMKKDCERRNTNLFLALLRHRKLRELQEQKRGVDNGL